MDFLDADTYHATPALSSGGVRTLISKCPAAYWYESPFNPVAVTAADRTLFDIGTAAHLAILERDQIGARVQWLPYDDFRTKAAQQEREAARASGKLPLLEKHAEILWGVEAAIEANPTAAATFEGGVAERSVFYAVDGVPCKARLDYLSGTGTVLTDLKTTTSAHPEAFARKVAQMGYHQQAAWYLDAAAAVGARPTTFRFVVVESAPPYLTAVYDLAPSAIEWGRMLNAKAVELFQQCRAAGVWPGYPTEPQVIDLPSWLHFQLEERRANGEFQTGAMLRQVAGADAGEDF